MPSPPPHTGPSHLQASSSTAQLPKRPNKRHRKPKGHGGGGGPKPPPGMSAPTLPGRPALAAVPLVPVPPPPPIPQPSSSSSAVVNRGGIVKHSSFSSLPGQRGPTDQSLLVQLKRTILSGAHPAFSAIIKPLAQKAVTVSREEADRAFEPAFGLGLSGEEANGMVERAKEEGVRLMREAEAQAQAQSHVAGAREREEEVRRVEEENERARVERVRAEKVRLAKEIAETERLLAERSRERLVTPTTTSDRVVMSQVPPRTHSAERISPAPWDPKSAGASDRISMASLARSTPQPQPPTTRPSPPVVVPPPPPPPAAPTFAAPQPVLLPGSIQPDVYLDYR